MGIHRATRRRVRRQLGLEPLSGAQVELPRLFAKPPGTGVSAAARKLSLASNSVSTLVNQLVTKGYLQHEPSATGRRAAVLTTTDAGDERLARSADERLRPLAAELAQLDPADVAALREALPALRQIATGLTDPQDLRHPQPHDVDPSATSAPPRTPHLAQSGSSRDAGC